jgi:hypothetical protein
MHPRIHPAPAALATTAAVLLTGALASAAAAGGWALATLDAPPTEPGVGGTVTVGFTLMQHGVTPVDWGQPLVMLVETASGETVTAVAHPSGSVGHWTAQLTVPAAGSWNLSIRHELQVEPGTFKPFSVGDAAEAAAGPPLSPALGGAALFLALLLVVAAAIGAGAWRRSRTIPVGT